MQDVFGNELNIGDKVIFIHNKSRLTYSKIKGVYIRFDHKLPNLKIGIVTRFYKSSRGDDELSVGKYIHIPSCRVALISKLKNVL